MLLANQKGVFLNKVEPYIIYIVYIIFAINSFHGKNIVWDIFRKKC